MIVDYQCTNYIGDTLVGFVKMVKKDKGEVAHLFKCAFCS